VIAVLEYANKQPPGSVFNLNDFAAFMANGGIDGDETPRDHQPEPAHLSGQNNSPGRARAKKTLFNGPVYTVENGGHWKLGVEGEPEDSNGDATVDYGGNVRKVLHNGGSPSLSRDIPVPPNRERMAPSVRDIPAPSSFGNIRRPGNFFASDYETDSHAQEVKKYMHEGLRFNEDPVSRDQRTPGEVCCWCFVFSCVYVYACIYVRGQSAVEVHVKTVACDYCLFFYLCLCLCVSRSLHHLG
jgi:hypothetical protein